MQDKNKRKIIGVVAASASQSEQKQLISGIIFRANELNADVAVFSNIYNTAKYHAHVEIENKIYDLINSKKLDGIIVLSESILNEMLLENIKQKLLSRTDIPIISIGEVFREFQSIDNDTMKDIMKITEHLVEVHGFTDIHMLTGPKHMNISNIRVEGYKEVLVSHGIPFDQSKVIYGNFWMNTGEDVAMEYITGKRHLPEAIICANDYMAYGVCDKFLENGISIPKDVTVIGYEFVGERYYHAPILTTYLRNRKAVGMKAAETICAIINGTEPKEISLDGHMIYGNSCSCCTDNKILFKEQSIVRYFLTT
jgi:DNA-binding LacI/PurR family transcriptional regulator